VKSPYRAGGAVMGLPVEVAEGQTGEEVWGQEMVDVVGVVVLDCE
jgi:hypothetical protein